MLLLLMIIIGPLLLLVGPARSVLGGACGTLTDVLPDNTPVQEQSNTARGVFQGGGLFPVPTMEEFAALGHNPASVVVVCDGELGTIANTTVDGTLLRERGGSTTVVTYGGAKFAIPSDAEFDALGLDAANVRIVPSGGLSQVSDVPRDGTLLRERPSTEVYALVDGRRRSVLNSGWLSGGRLMSAGQFTTTDINVVPDGALARFSYGGSYQWEREDGTLVKENSQAQIFLFQGGHPFPVPSQEELTALFPSGYSVETLPDNTITSEFTHRLPRDHSILRERTSTEIVVILNGTKFTAPDNATLTLHGLSVDDVRIVPSGALANLPYGGTLLDRTGMERILALQTSPGGTITTAPAPSARGEYQHGTQVSLRPVPAPGYAFVNWIVDGVAAGSAVPYVITMNAPHRVSARFTPLASALPSSPPAPTTPQPLTVQISGPGSVSAGSGTHPAGTPVGITAFPQPGAIFAGWYVDGRLVGWANPLTITMNTGHEVRAAFAPRQTFADATPDVTGATEAIAQLAAREIIRGCDPGAGLFCPTDPTLRAQMAVLIVRAMGWGGEIPANPFSDRNGVDDELWQAIATLADHGVAKGYGGGLYGTTDPVLNAQVVSFITRAMVEKGYWQFQPDDGSVYPNVAADSGHRQDLVTYVAYAGSVRGADNPTAPFEGWDAPSSRAWFAFVLWQALDSYFVVDRVP